MDCAAGSISVWQGESSACCVDKALPVKKVKIHEERARLWILNEQVAARKTVRVENLVRGRLTLRSPDGTWMVSLSRMEISSSLWKATLRANAVIA